MVGPDSAWILELYEFSRLVTLFRRSRSFLRSFAASVDGFVERFLVTPPLRCKFSRADHGACRLLLRLDAIGAGHSLVGGAFRSRAQYRALARFVVWTGVLCICFHPRASVFGRRAQRTDWIGLGASGRHVRGGRHAVSEARICVSLFDRAHGRRVSPNGEYVYGPRVCAVDRVGVR